MVKCIGVLTSGGDAPGMNAAVRAVARTCLNKGIEVYGVRLGYKGLYEGDFIKFDRHSTRNIINLGGTILKSARFPEFKDPEIRKVAIEQMKKVGMEALVVIGGDGSYNGALKLTEMGVNCIGIPGTIDNDIPDTDFTVGFDTALNTIVDALDRLRDTSSSHHRCFVVEVMGNNADNLALYAAISCGSELVITNKTGYDEEHVIKELIKNEIVYNKRHAIVIASEKILDVEKLAQRISEETGFSGRSIVLGHIQRGGSPVPEDRILAARMANKAIELLQDNQSGKCVCLQDGKIVAKDIETALQEVNKSNQMLYQLFDDLV